MRVIGIDLGSRRVGVALSDSAGRLATPREVIARRPPGSGGRSADHAALARIIEESGAELVVVGLPRSLDGRERQAARDVRSELDELARVLPVPVTTFDERLTTVEAHRSLAGAGAGSRRRRRTVDAVAASILLQAYLDAKVDD